jgi:hypothetical protein
VGCAVLGKRVTIMQKDIQFLRMYVNDGWKIGGPEVSMSGIYSTSHMGPRSQPPPPHKTGGKGKGGKGKGGKGKGGGKSK